MKFNVTEERYRELFACKCMCDMLISILKNAADYGAGRVTLDTIVDAEWIENTIKTLSKGEDEYVQ